jgi:hypothetical protein
MMTIRVHDQMPMFTITRADGTRVRYENIWQRKNLLLVSLPADDPASSTYAASLDVLAPDLDACDAVLLVTRERIEGVPSPGVVVADRWGEVYHVKEADRAAVLPAPGELSDWLRFVRNECPECQGETR